MSKEVYKTIKHEHGKLKQLDQDLVAIIRKQKANYIDEDEGKAITGFIQDIQIDPLSISMWSEEDVDYFHSVGNDTTIIIDATCGVADKKIKKRIHYFALILNNMMKKNKTEPSYIIDLWDVGPGIRFEDQSM